jgi:hypothetical protein
MNLHAIGIDLGKATFQLVELNRASEVVDLESAKRPPARENPADRKMESA